MGNNSLTFMPRLSIFLNKKIPKANLRPHSMVYVVSVEDIVRMHSSQNIHGISYQLLI